MIDEIRRLLGNARSSEFLDDRDAFQLLDLLGFRTPHRTFFDADAPLDRLDLASFPGDRVVVKMVSKTIAHKTELGGVLIARRDPEAVRSAIATLRSRVRAGVLSGFGVYELVPHEPRLGHELLLGYRHTTDFGPVVVVAPGGTHAEAIASRLAAEGRSAILSPWVHGDGTATIEALRHSAVVPLVTETLRGQAPPLAASVLVETVRRFLDLARADLPILDLEINPLVVSGGSLVALDVLVRPGVGPQARPPRPVHKIASLLHPSTMAIIGVSSGENPGRVVLRNVLGAGFDPRKVTIVKPGQAEIDGCRCVPSVQDLPEPVDLTVLAVGASTLPETLEALIAGGATQSVILIPAGLEEKTGSEAVVGRVFAALESARTRPDRGPVLNGGNCLGVRSEPGGYDALFIPRFKLPRVEGAPAPVAVISQSGAFLVTMMDRFGDTKPRYAISVGNQTDLTIGDYLEFLRDDPEIRCFAVYVEGFRPLDGPAFLRAVSDITSTGRTVVFYRAGRTAAGARASASHTASISGDYAVARSLAVSAGAVVTESLDEFRDLVTLWARWAPRTIAGCRVGAVTNAGFECVSIADNLGGLELAAFGEDTRARLAVILRESRVDTVVDVHNPLDLTPIAGDEAFAGAVECVLGDPGVDLGIIGCVPLTPALTTLPRGNEHPEDVTSPRSIAMRLGRLWKETERAWLVVVDAGAVYDPAVRVLEGHGVPVFRSSDRATRLADLVCRERTKPPRSPEAPRGSQ